MKLHEVAEPQLPIALSMAMKLVRKGQDLHLCIQKVSGEISGQHGGNRLIRDIQLLDHIDIVDILVGDDRHDAAYELERFKFATIKTLEVDDGEKVLCLIIPSSERFEELKNRDQVSE